MFKIKLIKTATIAIAFGAMIAFTSTPSYAVLGDQVLKSGMVHEDVQLLQKELLELGFFKTENTTVFYGSITEEALMEFQIANNLEPDGIFGKGTYETLQAVKTAKGLEKENIALVFDRDISLEMRGDDVRLVQEALKGLEYLDIDNCTEYYGPMTQESIIAFQEANNLKPDGIVGLRTVEAINSALLGRGIKLPAANRSVEVGSLSAKLAATAKQYLGHRYVSGGSSPSGFDCSGFTSYVYRQHGITIPRASTAQAYVGTQLSKSDLLPGDLLIFSNTYKAGPSHTGIYLGNGQFIHASTPSKGVIIADLNSAYYVNHFTYGRRLY